jgi:arylsulfatase A-like enzyme
MKTKKVGASLALLAAALLAGILAYRAEGGRARPRYNLIVVVIDTLRQDRVSAYGYGRRTTPFLDRLAAEGARADGLSPTPWTKAATATLLTGLNPLRHQTYSESDVIPPEVPTLAERLRSAGYDTLGVSSNGWVSRAWGFDRGFGEFLSIWRLGHGKFPSARIVNQEMFPRLAGLRQPFFLYVHYLDPHMPYDPPYAWNGEPLPAELAAHVPFLPEDYKVRGVLRPLPEKVAIATELYDGEVRANDDALAELYAELGARGLLERTLSVVTSDHGEEFGEHGRVGHGQALYQESVAVPLVFHAPGLVAAGSVFGTVGLEDVVPTVLDLLRVDGPREPAATAPDGISYAAPLRSGVDPAAAGDRLLHVDFRWGAALALVRGREKLLLAERPAYAKELLNLAADPGERQNLLAAPDDATAARFASLARRLADDYGALVQRAAPRKTTSADAELVDQIKALGYIQAFQDRSARRSFPRRLEPASAIPGGLRGWENLAGAASCFGLAGGAPGQLLMGWHATEEHLGGRWSYPEATVWLPLAAAVESFRLTLEGENYSPLDRSLEVEVGDSGGPPVGIWPVARGPFRVEAGVAVSTPGATATLLRLRVTPPYFPPEHGIEDHRALGLFFRRICLEVEPARRAGKDGAGDLAQVAERP